MKIRLTPHRCTLCGSCWDVAPGLYDVLIEAGCLTVPDDRPDRQQQARDAASVCQHGALEVVE